MLPQDCSVLQTCISEYFTEANAADGNQAYAQYLSSAPSISDPTVFQQCGETRNYFGFDDTFLNDNAICEDVYQMRYSRSFDFLEDFFGDSGSSTAQTGSGDGTGELVPLVLTPIDRSKCNSLRFSDADFGQWSQYSQFISVFCLLCYSRVNNETCAQWTSLEEHKFCLVANRNHLRQFSRSHCCHEMPRRTYGYSPDYLFCRHEIDVVCLQNHFHCLEDGTCLAVE